MLTGRGSAVELRIGKLRSGTPTSIPMASPRVLA